MIENIIAQVQQMKKKAPNERSARWVLHEFV
jgi:hypothetical protein